MLPLDAEHILRPVNAADGPALARAYSRNREHLEQWEPVRDSEFYTPEWQSANARQCVEDAVAGRNVRFVIESSDGEIRGRVNLNNIVRGAFRSADLGYWVDADRLHRGLASSSVALIAEHAQNRLGLHRLQAATLLRNSGSQHVLLRNGFATIGIAPAYLRIAGEWQDHMLFQLLLEEQISSPGLP